MNQTLEMVNQIPQLIHQLELALRSGYSLSQAFAMLGDDLPAPLGNELQRVANRLASGTSLPVALDQLVERVPHVDIDLLVATIKVQLEVGGNLADKLGFLLQLMAKRQIDTGGP